MKVSKFIKNAIKLMIMFIVLLSGATNIISADEATISSEGTLIDENLDIQLIDVKTATSIISDMPGDYVSKNNVELNKPYKTTYKNIDYFGKKIDLVVEAKAVDFGYEKEINYINLYYDSSKKVNYIGVGEAVGTTFDIKISFYDTDGNEYFFTGLLGFSDPDESNYLFNTAGRKFYYTNNKGKDWDSGGPEYASDGYAIRSNGLFNTTVDGIELTGDNYDLIQTKAQFWYNAKFFVELNKESTFEFRQQAIAPGSSVYPYLYSWQYSITYKLNGGTNNEKNPTKYIGGEEKDILNPTRPGYKFLGWTREDIDDPNDSKNTSVKTDDIGDKIFIAQWEKIEYQLAYDKNFDQATGTMDKQIVTIGDNNTNPNQFAAIGYNFEGWNTASDNSGIDIKDSADVVIAESDIEGKEDGAVVKVLYAKWKPAEYKIKYKPNADNVTNPDAMVTQVFDVVTNPDKWNSNDLIYERVGYDLAGYKIENEGDTLTSPDDYKNYLLNDDDKEVTLYAQWKPWEYYIKYNGNGADNPDAMPTQTFDYFAESMRSNSNAFKRDGYRFTGFKVSINGDTRIIRNPEDFVKVLKGMDPYSSITLVAQWDEIPQRYTTPVTGIK
jgi:uncharacterized repeat protein (TIGR02543 family)